MGAGICEEEGRTNDDGGGERRDGEIDAKLGVGDVATEDAGCEGEGCRIIRRDSTSYLSCACSEVCVCGRER